MVTRLIAPYQCSLRTMYCPYTRQECSGIGHHREPPAFALMTLRCWLREHFCQPLMCRRHFSCYHAASRWSSLCRARYTWVLHSWLRQVDTRRGTCTGAPWMTRLRLQQGQRWRCLGGQALSLCAPEERWCLLFQHSLLSRPYLRRGCRPRRRDSRAEYWLEYRQQVRFD